MSTAEFFTKVLSPVLLEFQYFICAELGSVPKGFLVKVRQWHVRSNFINPLAYIIAFSPSMVQYCLMHTLHLGILHHVNGGALLCLMALGYFGALSQDSELFIFSFTLTKVMELN